MTGPGMTGTRAVAQFADGVKSAALFFVFVLTVVSGMTARAVRLIRRVGPGQILAVVRVTIGTTRIAAMISRIVAGAVRKIDLQPRVCTVTLVTLQRGDKVIGRLARSRGAVMATRTRSRHRVMIHLCHRRPGDGRMAVLTVICALDMRRPLALRRCAVMAAETCSRNSGMIKYGRCPGCRGMAIITDVIARDVISRLAHGGGAVVAAFTGPVNGRMIHLHRRTPGRR